MEREKVVKVLAEFFMDQFSEDAMGVGEWLAHGGNDVDQFYEAVKALNTSEG